MIATQATSTLLLIQHILSESNKLARNKELTIDKNYDLSTMVQGLGGTLVMQQKSTRELDQELIYQVKKGDKTAFKEIYSRFSQVTYNLVLRILRDKEDAEEVVQEIFLQVWNKAYT